MITAGFFFHISRTNGKPPESRLNASRLNHRIETDKSYLFENIQCIVPIPSFRKESRIWENLGAADIYLTQEEGFRMDHALEHMTMSQAFGGYRSN